MKIVTSTCVFPKEYPADAAIRRLAALGFEGVDIAFDYYADSPDCPFRGDGWEAWAQDLRRLAEECGVTCRHAHAPGDFANHSETMRRCFAACQILGVRYMVIHPINLNDDKKALEDEEEFMAKNLAALPPLLRWAEECGVVILVENLPWSACKHPCVCARLVEEVNHPNFGWCYDTGHANAKGLCAKTLLDVKHVPLSLHIHDNLGRRDDHSLPGDGTIDWKEFLDVLLEIGYKGDVVLEAHHQSLEAPDEQRDAILAELYKRAEKMRAYLLSKG